jgi:hypothetical protein
MTYTFPTPEYKQMLYYEGCIGFTREMYEDDEQIESGPGLVIPLTAMSMRELEKLLVIYITAVSQNKIEQVKQVAKAQRNAAKSFSLQQLNPGQTGGGTTTWGTSELTGAKRNGTQSPFEKYDERAEYQRRLRELLVALNLMHWEKTFLADYDAKVEEAKIEKQQANKDPIANMTQKIDQLDDAVDIDMSDVDLSTPQLPSLSAGQTSKTSKTSQGTAAKSPYYLLGPAYVILSNDSDTKSYIEAYIFFPSMTSEMKPSPNYDFLGKSHQWLNRLFRDDMYAAKGTGCEQPCLGTPTVLTTKQVKCDKHNTIYACGCRTDNETAQSCFDARKDYRREIKLPEGKPPIKSQPIMYQFSVYRINIRHSLFSSLFKADSPLSLVLNVIPSDWSIFPGCKYMFLSRNRQFYTRLDTVMLAIPGTRRGRGRRATQEYEPVARFAIYKVRREDVLKLCQQKKEPQFSIPIFTVQASGYAKHVAIEGNMLNLYTSEEQDIFSEDTLAWNIQIASDDAVLPVAIIVLDNGKLDVVDQNNKSVISPVFAKYVESGQSVYSSTQPDKYSGASRSDEYDPISDYQKRLEMLRVWLRNRNLLREIDQRFSSYIEKNGTRPLITQELQTFESYDPTVDYEQRINTLIAELIRRGFSVRPESPSLGETSIPTRQSARPSATPTQTFIPYDSSADLETRMRQLQQAIHR